MEKISRGLVDNFIHSIGFFGNPDGWRKMEALKSAVAFCNTMFIDRRIINGHEFIRSQSERMDSMEEGIQREVFAKSVDFVDGNFGNLIYLDAALDNIIEGKREVNPFGVGSKRINLLEFLNLGRQKNKIK